MQNFKEELIQDIKVYTGRILAIAFAVAAMFGMPGIAAAQPTLSSDVGVDITSWVAVVAAGIGAVVAACLAVLFVFLIIRVGMRWIRGMG